MVNDWSHSTPIVARVHRPDYHVIIASCLVLGVSSRWHPLCSTNRHDLYFTPRHPEFTNKCLLGNYQLPNSMIRGHDS